MLTDAKIRNAKPKNKEYRIADSNGLAIAIKTSGSKLWRYRYRWQNKATMLSLGSYPEVSLFEARRKRDELRSLLKLNINPKSFKHAEIESGITFKKAFDHWHKSQSSSWTSSYANDTIKRAEKYLIKYIGNKPIKDISSRDIKTILLDLNDRDLLDTLEKIRGIAKRVFTYAVGMDWIEINPARDIPLDIFKKKKNNHYATITNPKDIGKLLNAIDMYKGSREVWTALNIAPHVFLRPSELSGLRWSEIDGENQLIRIHPSRMKTRQEHIVPISRQVGDMLFMLRGYPDLEEEKDFVFPGRSFNRSITADSLRVAIRSLGYTTEQFTTHGFRHMASTRLNEMGYRGDLIERQLAHRETNNVRAVYNHADYLEERREMMQSWSDYLDDLREKNN